MAAPVLRHQRQPGQVPDRPVRAQHRISQPRQLISPRGQAGMEIPPEPRQHGERLDTGGIFSKLSITAFVRDRCPLARTHDHPEPVLAHRDAPDNTGKTPDQKPQRLSDKLGHRDELSGRAVHQERHLPSGVTSGRVPGYQVSGHDAQQGSGRGNQRLDLEPVYPWSLVPGSTCMAPLAWFSIAARSEPTACPRSARPYPSCRACLPGPN
jgi:hypothetical protein